MESLEKYIVEFENVISDKLCENIISEYDNFHEWTNAETASGFRPNVRNCSSINMSEPKIIIRNEIPRKNIDNNLYLIFSDIANNLQKKYANLVISKDSGYNLLKYQENQFYIQHVDSSATYPRTISCSICLNDNYEGGEFCFFDGKLKYNLKKGSAIAFPSNFMYPHQIRPVTRGTRYSIITWFN